MTALTASPDRGWVGTRGWIAAPRVARQTLARAQELLGVARETGRHVESIDRRTGGVTP